MKMERTLTRRLKKGKFYIKSKETSVDIIYPGAKKGFQLGS